DSASLALDAALAPEEPWSVLDAIPGLEIAADLPSLSKSDPEEDLGFSLDWSDPDAAAPVAELPASATTTAEPADDLGFWLDWSDPEMASYASTWGSAADTTNDQIITAHWDDPANTAPEEAALSDLPATADADATDYLDLAQSDTEQVHLADQPS